MCVSLPTIFSSFFPFFCIFFFFSLYSLFHPFFFFFFTQFTEDDTGLLHDLSLHLRKNGQIADLETELSHARKHLQDVQVCFVCVCVRVCVCVCI